MKSSSLTSAKHVVRAGSGIGASLLRRAVLRQLKQLRHGQLVIVEGDERMEFGDAHSSLSAEIQVQDGAVWGLVAGNGSIGSGEAYIHGYWTTPDLTAVIRVFVSNLDVLDAMESGLAQLGRPLIQGLHWLNRNTRKGSRKNISAHYDLGNDLFEQFLDPTMMYSAAMFRSADDSLEQAQLNKLERICQKLALKPSDHLLEIGTGWGSMAIYAATHYGCKVTTTTLSREQYAYTERRIQEQGLQGQITLLLEDYRDLTGQYDKLVSIEMIEAIGHQYLETYLAKCASLLKPEGLALIQAITIEDHRYEQALRSVDFIKRHVFPGSFIPSVAAMVSAKSRASDLALVQMEDFGLSYARTLQAWRQRFLTCLPQVRAQGFDDRFIRMWEFYLAYCEGGFRERSIGDVHLLFARPGNRRPQYLPAPEAT